MRYYKIVSDGCILLVGVGAAGVEITQDEYNEIMTEIKNAPKAPDGYAYVLTESMEWELVKVETPVSPEEATETDYQAALEEMGVTFDD